MKKLVPILILGFIGFVTSFGAHIVAVNLPIYAQIVGVGVAMIGLLIAVYDIAEIAAKPVFGSIADQRGMRVTMSAGIFVFILASLLYLWLDPRLLLGIRFLQGVGAAALSAVSLALVAVYAREWRGRAYGIYNAIKGTGYVVSPIIGGLILLHFDFKVIFLFSALVGIIAFGLSLFLPKADSDQRSVFEDEGDFSFRGLLWVFRDPKLQPWYVVTVINMFFVGILFGFFPVRVHSLGYSPLISGLILSVLTASYLLVQPLAGAIADRSNPGVTIQIGLLLSGISIITAPFVRDIPLFIVSMLAGAGIGTVWTNTDAMISTLADSSSLGATMGAAGTFKELGDMLGPILVGLISQALGLDAGFVICGALGLLMLPMISRNRQRTIGGAL